MKYRLANFSLTLAAVALLAANWQIYHPNSTRGEAVARTEGARESKPPSLANATNFESQGPANTPSSHARPSFDWAEVETTEYRQYAQTLRAIGFPKELVRSIIIADVDELYEPRERELKPKPLPYDTPPSQRLAHDLSPAEWQRVIDLWHLRLDKQRVLEEILGEYVPREMLKTPVSMRNYEAYEYAISLMPPEKRNAVQFAQETEILVEGMNKDSIKDHALELEAFKQSCAERDASLHQVLTPDEFELYEMNTAPVGTELARRVIGMAPTQEEFVKMYRIALKNWIDIGGVYGRWRALPVSPARIAAADAEMNASLKEALGPERFLDYQMAITDTGQQLRNFAARFELPRQTVAEAFELQSRLDGLARTRRVEPSGPAPAQTTAETQTQLEDQFQQVLGPQLWQAWQDGKSLRVSLDP